MASAPPLESHLKTLLLLLAAVAALRADSYFVILSGVGGTPEYESLFAKWTGDLKRELEKNGPTAHVSALSGDSAHRENIQKSFADLSVEVQPSDSFALFLIGHGTFDGVDYKFNIPGPDLTASELANLLGHVGTKRQLVVNMTSCSGASAEALASAGRIVITATKSGTEKNATVFPRYWVDSMRDPAADADKNGTLTTLEAYRYTTRRVASYFESEKLLATEHAQLSDNAKTKASRDPGSENGQGTLAARFAILRPPLETAENASPDKQKLIARKEDLEAKIDKLKAAKAAMTPDDYKQQLTALLLDLARTQAEIDK